ncbi:CDP-diacylglycerol diphosphatase [Nonomuraea glycinis]|uniref:CDP-diacylglycerol diphosphatase n=1 Tax=Nonomuraea glycinis TaxID=2047744 RepID=UPI0033B610D7
MGENGTPENAADRLTRRRFVRFSGLAGASVVLAAVGQDLAAADEPTPPPPTVGGPDPTVCGSTSSTDPLWVSMQRCHSNNSCLQNGDDYVVMPGNNNASGYTNYILVPTQRINGIECPWICDSHAPNYWDAANYFATRPPTVVRAPVGLGINSQRARNFNQLHIHMATARPVSRNDLESQQGNAAHNVADWAHTRVSVRGFSEQLGVLPHVYRVLIWPGFSHDNLFDMLRTMLVHALGQGATVADAQDQMRFQTLIVIPRTSGGYFIVNSESQLRDPNNHQLVGTNTCDPLLLLHP